MRSFYHRIKYRIQERLRKSHQNSRASINIATELITTNVLKTKLQHKKYTIGTRDCSIQKNIKLCNKQHT